MGPLGGRGWHPISRAASPLLDVPIPPIQTYPSPADTPQGSPTPYPSPDIQAPPHLVPSRTATSSQPPSDTPPIPLTDLNPSPTLHTPLLVAGGHAPSLARESLRPLPAFLVRGRCDRAAPRVPLMPLPSWGEGRAPFTPGALGPAPSAWTIPFLRMLNASWEEGAGPS